MPIIIPDIKTCDVCRLIDGDSSPKQVIYCYLCDSWICLQDQRAWLRRTKAAIKRKLESNYKGDPNY